MSDAERIRLLEEELAFERKLKVEYKRKYFSLLFYGKKAA